MAGRRIAERLGNKPAVKGSNGLGLVGELASEIANEYAADLKRGAQLGPLSDFVDAVKGPTSKLADDLSAVRSSLLGPAKPRAVAPAAADVTPVADLPAADSPRDLRAEIEAKKRRIEALKAGGVAAADAADAAEAEAAPAGRPAQPSFVDVATEAARRLQAASQAEAEARRVRRARERERADRAAAERAAMEEAGRAADAMAAAAPVAPDAAVSVEAGVAEPAAAGAWPFDEVAVEAVAVEAVDVEAVDVDGGEAVVEATVEATFAEVLEAEVFEATVEAELAVEVDAGSTRPMRSADASAPEGSALDVALDQIDELVDLGGEGEGEGEAIDAVDVSVTSVEEDADEVAQQRQTLLLDAVLITLEAALGKASSQLAAAFTPEEARGWELLGAFRLQDSPAEQKAARAKERLLDEIARGLDRR